jgi:methylated-DNA-[protein]-cysteine S-methyltransferase
MTDHLSAVMDSPLGRIALYASGGRLRRIEYGVETPDDAAPAEVSAGEVLRQLRRYFRDARFPLDLPVDTAGTPFQRRVWNALRAIPSGETRTYGELAAELGTSARAVGNACRANPVPIVVPCHRVVAADGLGGFSGATAGPRLAAKRWLLAHEGGLPAP